MGFNIQKRNKAIKIYSPDKPYDYVAEKARIQALAYNAGLSVPAVNGVKTSTSYILHFFAFITLTCKKQRKN